jgi:hypothetical protein
MSKPAKTDSWGNPFVRFSKKDAEKLGKQLADQLIQGNEQFRSAKEHVDRELARGGRTAKGSFRL